MSEYEKIDLHKALDMLIESKDIFIYSEEINYINVNSINTLNQYYKKKDPLVLFVNSYDDGSGTTFKEINKAIKDSNENLKEKFNYSRIAVKMVQAKD